ncbi:MAG: ribulose-phosphate 3-epimerase [Chitinophagales bacterium]|nr:ribulose-phosphate 3-epimerase [Chitinophagales bacterium]
MSHLVAPSILACDFAYIARDIEMCNNAGADWIHVDVMDGMYVPNISFGLPVVAAMKRHAKLPLDVHLMIEKPERYLKHFREAGADVITIHVEACTHIHAAIMEIKSLGAKAGVAINPGTPIKSLQALLPYIDLICLMSVNPGFGGQEFIPTTIDRCRNLKKLLAASKFKIQIEIDGGVKLDNAQTVLNAGADILVSGSGIFSHEDPTGAIHTLKSLKRNTNA